MVGDPMGLPPARPVTIGERGAVADFAVARGRASLTVDVDGTLRVDLNITVYGRLVCGRRGNARPAAGWPWRTRGRGVRLCSASYAGSGWSWMI
jgi:hypothetical protein